MADPLLNRLLDEATSRATELTGEATEAIAAVEALADRAKAWERTLVDRGGETLQRFRELQARCDAAASDLSESGDQAAQALDALDERARAAREHVGRLTESARDALSRLAAAADRQTAETGEATSDACLALEARQEAARALEADVEARVHQAEAEVAAFREAVSAAQARFEESAEGFEAAVDRLGEECRDATRSTVVAVELFLEHVAARQEQLGIDVHDASDQALAAVDHAYVEELPARLMEGYRPLEEAAVDLGRVTDRATVELEEAVGAAGTACSVELGSLYIPTGALALAAGLAG